MADVKKAQIILEKDFKISDVIREFSDPSLNILEELCMAAFTSRVIHRRMRWASGRMFSRWLMS
jgi:hypothetical protein